MNKLVKVCLNILTVLLCFLLFASTLATMLVADLQVALNPNNLKNAIKSTLSVPTYTQAKPIPAAAGGQLELEEFQNADILIQYAYDILKEYFGDRLTVTLEQVREFVENSTVKDFVAEKSAAAIIELLTGENSTTITSSEIRTLLQENKAAFQKHFQIELTDARIDAVTSAMDQIPAVQQIQKEGIVSIITQSSSSGSNSDSGLVDPSAPMQGESGSSSSASRSNPLAKVQGVVNSFISLPVLLGCIGICLVLLGLIFLCAWNRPYKALIAGGIPVLLAGLVFFVPTMVAICAPATWLNLLSFAELVGPVSMFLLKLVAPVCITVTVLGVLMIVGGIVLCCIMKKSRKAKAAVAEENPAAEEVSAVEDTPVAEEIPAAEDSAAVEPAAEEIPAE